MRTTLATRIALLTTAVAAAAVLIAGAVSYGLVQSTAEAETRRQLGRFANVAADTQVGNGVGLSGRFATELRSQGVEIVRLQRNGLVRSREPHAAKVAEPYMADLAAGRPVSAITDDGYLVEGRPLDAGAAMLLVQPRSQTRAFGFQILGRTAIALVIGLTVAALAGWLLARRFARPLRDTARAAHRLANGQRLVRVPEAGPLEVADVAASINTLASALETSEGRQREFLLSISHELRTPLTAVKGFAESLADGVTTGEDVRAVGATMLAESDRLSRLVTDLLDLARLGAQDFRLDIADVDIAELIAEAGDVWRARCDAVGVEFEAQTDGPVLVRADPVRVRQILDGLAENALRVTPAGAPIVFGVHATPGWGVLEVRDGGPGLTQDDCSVAFERSVLYDRYRGVRRVGTGVGLALVQGLATRLGGRASAGTAPEGGACFSVRLPAVQPPEPTVSMPAEMLPPPRAGWPVAGDG